MDLSSRLQALDRRVFGDVTPQVRLVTNPTRAALEFVAVFLLSVGLSLVSLLVDAPGWLGLAIGPFALGLGFPFLLHRHFRR